MFSSVRFERADFDPVVRVVRGGRDCGALGSSCPEGAGKAPSGTNGYSKVSWVHCVVLTSNTLAVSRGCFLTGLYTAATSVRGESQLAAALLGIGGGAALLWLLTLAALQWMKPGNGNGNHI